MNPPGQLSVLVIEPEPAVSALVAAVLRRRGIAAVCESAAEAAALRVRSTDYAAVIIEPRMPGGEALLREICAAPTATRGVIIATTQGRLAPSLRRLPAVRAVLIKPFDLDDLAAAIAACVAASDDPDRAGSPPARHRDTHNNA